MLTKPEIESFSDEELDSLKELLEEEFRRRALPETAQKQILARMNRRDLRCPVCKSKLQKDGKRKDGVQVYFCPICRKHYSDTTGSSLSTSKLKTEKIREIITLVMLGCPDWVIAVLAKISDKTAQFWRDRCLDAADAWADEGKLSGKIYLDEMLFSPSRAEEKPRKTADGTYSKSVYLSVAFDSKGHGFCYKYDKPGTPTEASVFKALGERIEPGSRLIHDKAKYHSILIEKLKLKDEGIKADVESEAYRTKLRLLNNCCSVIRYSFESHRGIKTEKLESYANLFLYRWVHERKDGFETTVGYLFNRVCGTKRAIYSLIPSKKRPFGEEINPKFATISNKKAELLSIC